jgi:hypothetical protein
MIDAKPKFLNGVYAFSGSGYDKPAPLSDELDYTVPSDMRTQLIYFRAGNSSSELVYLVLLLNGKPMRYFPLGAKSAQHIQLAVVEDIFPESKLEVFFAAPPGTQGSIVIDVGLLEI